MRELEFRALRKHKHSPSDIDYSDSWVTLSEFFSHLEVNYPEAIIMQYTGLKDAYGVGIYEGDILNFGNGTILEVKFEHGCFQVGGLLLYKCHNACKVWGNVYQNPELLSNEN